MLQEEGASSQSSTLVHDNTQLQAHCKVGGRAWGGEREDWGDET